MILQLLIAGACLGAGVFQLLAALPKIGERTILRVARRITAAAMILASAYIVYSVFTYPDGANPVYCWIMALFALGQVLFSMNTFMEPHKTEALIRSATQKAKIGEATHA